jgi:hypothetical protein
MVFTYFQSVHNRSLGFGLFMKTFFVFFQTFFTTPNASFTNKSLITHYTKGTFIYEFLLVKKFWIFFNLCVLILFTFPLHTCSLSIIITSLAEKWYFCFRTILNNSTTILHFLFSYTFQRATTLYCDLLSERRRVLPSSGAAYGASYV